MKRVQPGELLVVLPGRQTAPECDGCEAGVGANRGGWLIGKTALCDACVVEMAAESAAQVRVLRGDSAEVRR